MYRLLLEKNGEALELSYNPHTSQLLKEGRAVIDQRAFLNLPPATMVTSEAPGLKSRQISVLKIQMGLKCNYSCSYCLQASQRGKEYGNASVAHQFLDKMQNWFSNTEQGAGTRIEFWGGEPFVYWKVLKILGDGLRERYPKLDFNIITNGSLLDDEKIDWLVKNNFAVAISHDGPAMAQRGPDPLDDAQSLAMIKKLHIQLSPHRKLSFNCVLTRNNYSLAKVRSHLAEKLGVAENEILLGTEGPALLYDANAESSMARNEAEWLKMFEVMSSEMAGPEGELSTTYLTKKNEFIKSLQYQQPSYVLGQRCGMDKAEIMAVDLSGNVITCQNVSAQQGHKIGHVDSLENVRLTTAHHWSSRKECSDCPVLQLCQGSCMFLKEDLWEKSCDLSYVYNLAAFSAALQKITGGYVLKEISGPQIRGGRPSHLFSVEQKQNLRSAHSPELRPS